ncbi:MAG: YhfC family intramembrane metalloprotease [Sandaracinaceae bacterium]|nr:YhfC family intramembrane metalloprotease [Sandaracinaceae bacterium]
MGGLAAAYAVEVVVVFGAAIGLAVWLRRRTRVGYALVGVGALVMIASQVVHLPLNWALGHVLPSGRLGITAAVLGLSAGLCEELARYVAIRFFAKRVRDTEHALMLGAGHGGIEAAFVGVLAVIMLINLLVLQRQGDAVLAGLSPEDQLVAAASIERIRALPVLVPLAGAAERLMVLPFHLAATLLVTAAVARQRPAWLLGAIAFHALLDGPMAYLAWTVGPLAAELWIAGVCVVSLVILWVVGRRMRRPPAHVEDVEPSGAPLELLKTSKTYGGTVRALKEASLVIEPGTRTCLLGPNGAGKTTTIRIVTGGVAPSGGHAFLFGHASGDDGFLDAKRRLGVVPQLPGMYEDLTVGAWLELVRDLYGRGDVGAIAKDLGLEELLDRSMGRLSGGQKRRVAIGAAVLGEPELLILDEPSAGLDPVASREVLDYLERLAPSHTILLCTHDLDEAEELCDRVVVMRGGRVLVHERIDDLRGRIQPQLALRVSSDLDAAEAALRELERSPTRAEEELLVAASAPDTDAPALLRALLARGVDVVECRVVRPTLEELFLDIVGSVEDGEEVVAEEAPPAEEPVPPAIPLGDLFGPATRRLLTKEWRQLRASGSAFWTSLLMPVFFLLAMPQSMIFTLLAAAEEESIGDPLPSFGSLGEIGEDPTRAMMALMPMFVTIAALVAPTALITHSIVSERETRTLELLVALPVRIQQVVAAKLACAFLFAFAVCGACTVAVGIELVALDLASIPEAMGLLVLCFAAIAQATASALFVALSAKDFRTANNLAGLLIAPAILIVIVVSMVVAGGLVRQVVIALLFAIGALAIGRVALRSATFEKLLA